MSHHHPTVIIGAGLGGLALALGLARAGREVHVYEQARELGEVGAGISLSPNAVKALRYLCLLYTSPSPRDGLLSRMPSSA